MTDTRALLAQALSALLLEATSPPLPTTQAAVDALSAALQAPQVDGFGGNLDEVFDPAPQVEPQPVAWQVQITDDDDGITRWEECSQWEFDCVYDKKHTRPLYAAPPAPAVPTDQRLLDLLARIHRDGGHYVSEHGIEKACVDADLVVAEMLSAKVPADLIPPDALFVCGQMGANVTRVRVEEPAAREPLTPRELELLDSMIEVQLDHARRCDSIANRIMAEKQKSWDMERVELLRKLRGITGESK